MTIGISSTLHKIGRWVAGIAPEVHPRVLLVNLMLAWIPRGVGSRLRTFAYRHLLGLDVGRGTVFLEPITIRGHGNPYKRLHIGRNCGLRDCVFIANAPITIEDGVWISTETLVTTDTFTIGPAGQRRGERVSLPVTIGAGSWITQNSSVYAGAKIGPGTLVTNRGAVVGELAGNQLAGGVPARSLKSLA